MSSRTKTTILAQHHADTLLNALAPPLTARHAHDLSADELPAPLDEHIIAAATDALNEGNTHYVDVPGIGPLRTALADYLNAAGAAYETANIIVTAGIQEARFLTVQLLEKQRIAIPAVVHPGVHRALGVRPTPYTTMPVDPDRALPTPDAVQAALAEGCDLLYLESPSRLTGAAYTAEEVRQIASLVRERGAAVIWDQGGAPWVAGDVPSLAAETGMAEQTALIGEAFPGIGLAGWFIGFIAAPQACIPPMQKQKQVMAICTSTASQYAALEAAEHFSDVRAARVQRLAAVRSRLAQLAPDAGATVLPGEAVNILALRLPAERKPAALAKLKQGGYAVADGGDFGADDVIRVTVTADDTAEQALRLFA